MKKKLIPKHLKGKVIVENAANSFANTWLGKLLTGFGNAQIAGDSGAATAVATASGYEYNPENRRFEQTEERLNDPSVKALRDNLAVLSTTNPITLEEIVIPRLTLYLYPTVKQTSNFIGKTFKNLSSKAQSYIERIRNRKLRMTHVTTMSDILNSINKGDRSLITPSFSIYKHNGNNLFMYNKENQPVIFIGNKKIINSPNYVLMKGDQGVPMLNHHIDNFNNKSNSVISREYVDVFGEQIKRKGYPFKEARKNLDYVNYNEGKYLDELPYDEISHIIGPNNKEFKEIFKYNPNITTYSEDWLKLDRNELRLNLLKLIEDLYRNNKNLRLKIGGKLNTKTLSNSKILFDYPVVNGLQKPLDI